MFQTRCCYIHFIGLTLRELKILYIFSGYCHHLFHRNHQLTSNRYMDCKVAYVILEQTDLKVQYVTHDMY